MNCFYLKVLSFIVFNIFLNFKLIGQDTRLVSTAYIAAGELVKGDLLIMLKSEKNRLDALNEELSKGDEKYKLKVTKLIQEIISDRDSFNMNFIKAIEQHYQFSKVYFFYDHDYLELVKSNFIGGRFLNNDLRKGFTRKFGNRPYYVLKFSKTKNQSLDAYILYDKNENIVPNPFPSIIRLNNFSTWKNNIFYSKTAHARNANYFAKKIQKSYRKIYEKFYKETFM